jgi:O-antigen ligase
MQIFSKRHIDFIALWSLTLIPVSLVFSPRVKPLIYLAAFMVAIYLLIKFPEKRKVYSEFRLVAYAFAFMLPYTFVSVWLHGRMLDGVDNALHFLLFLVIAACFQQLPSARIFWCGISAAAFGAGALAIYQKFGLHIDRPYGMYGISKIGLSGAIKFGMVTTVFSLLALIGALDKEAPLKFRVWHVIGAITGIAGCQVIGSRGPWIIMLLLSLGIVIGKLLYANRKQRWIIIAVSILVAVLLLAFFYPYLSNTLDVTFREAQAIESGDNTTSLGHRIELWKASIAMFLSHPLFGVGMQQFRFQLEGMIAAGQAPRSIAVFGHAHNEYLEFLANGGLFGFSYLLVLYGAPVVFFLRQLRIRIFRRQNATVPLAGLVTVLSFALFSFGDNIFDRQMTNSLFAFLTLGLAVLSLQPQPQPEPGVRRWAVSP